MEDISTFVQHSILKKQKKKLVKTARYMSGMTPAAPKRIKEVNKDFDIEGKRIAVNEGIRAIDLLDIKQLIPAEYVKACELLGRAENY